MGDTPRKQYRKFTSQQKTELVLASLRGQKSFAEICRENDIAGSLLRRWREFLAEGAERLSGTQERTELDDLRSKVAKLERALGRKTRDLGGAVAGMGLRQRVARSRELVAAGRQPALVARLAQISR